MADLGHFGRILDEVDERIGKLLDVVRLAARDDISIHDYRLVDHPRPGVPDVRAN